MEHFFLKMKGILLNNSLQFDNEDRKFKVEKIVDSTFSAFSKT